MRELARYEYFKPAPEDPHHDEMASYYQDELDFAYFAVRFGWSHEQYDSLTEVERMLIMKRIETETVQNQEMLQATIELAMSNVFRKKGKKYKKMFKRLKKKKDEQPISNEDISKIKKALLKAFKTPKKK